MTGIQPQLWVDRAADAVDFYTAAFGARVVHRVGEGDDIVAQLTVGDAAFWVSPGGPRGPRFSPAAIGGATGRMLLVVDDPDAVFAQAVAAGATAASEVVGEHGWRVGRIIDPFGHEWEIGKPLVPWPPSMTADTGHRADKPPNSEMRGVSGLGLPLWTGAVRSPRRRMGARLLLPNGVIRAAFRCLQCTGRLAAALTVTPTMGLSARLASA